MDVSHLISTFFTEPGLTDFLLSDIGLLLQSKPSISVADVQPLYGGILRYSASLCPAWLRACRGYLETGGEPARALLLALTEQAMQTPHVIEPPV
ncbi:hypothetical protein EXIGLDRAFT_723502 [Exidia glandulosa HHB12029]|uniref:Uncharacterized protein n=1 Tax=Exidia glandulosa HHB12029 TaxID=1314781 RepID=A0A165ETR3_EXIGL|nr:hypothetical protein EXIGLDRAFT_723502 [Exidia glandulosa HHB12029]